MWEHPDEEQIKKYIWQELNEEEEICLGEHMAECDSCAALARDEAEFRHCWENLAPETHGEFYWQKHIDWALEKAGKDSSSFLLSERIRRWKEEWKGRFGSMLRIVRSRGMMDAVAGLKGAFSLVSLQPVRGLGEDPQVRFQVPEGVPLELSVDRASGTFLAKIGDSLPEPPLILVIYKSGNPLVLLPEKVEGTSFYSLAYTPEEDCCLFIEPVLLA